MTPGMRELVYFISAYNAEHGYSPTYQEMRETLGYKSNGSIARMINSLVDRGIIIRVPVRSRALMVVVDVPDDIVSSHLDIYVIYTNYRGQSAIRRIIPHRFSYESTAWHPTPQWILWCYDRDRGEIRGYALKECNFNVTEDDR